ncbi:ribonuclease H-like domain-containing protein, partial [Tanacetum coccineum]
MAPEVVLSSSSSNVTIGFGDPLYLHPNDVTTSPLISIKLIGTENYNIWSCAMKHVIGSKNKLGFLDDTCKRPDDNDPSAKQWDMCNSVVLTWILNSISAELFVGQVFSKTASVVWADLQETYDKVDGLDDVYLPIRSNILTRDPLPSVKSTFAIISVEKSHRGISSNSTPSKPYATAFVSKGYDNKRTGRGPNLNLKCTNCLKPGHTVERCFELVGYYKKPNGQASSGQSQNKIASNNNAERPSTSSHVSLTNEQMLRLMNLINDKHASPISTNKADSGANQHMTISEKLLHNIVDIAHFGLTVRHPNRTHALIKKIGDLKLTKDITLYDVLVVSEYNASLLSVHKLARDNKLCVGFDEHKCYIQDLKKKELVEI